MGNMRVWSVVFIALLASSTARAQSSTSPELEFGFQISSWGLLRCVSLVGENMDHPGELSVRARATAYTTLVELQNYISEVTSKPWPLDAHAPRTLPAAYAEVRDGRLTWGYGNENQPLLAFPDIPLTELM